MFWSLYKKYFSVDVSYEDGAATSCKDLLIIPSSSTLERMKNHQLGYRSYEGGVLVYFQGTQDDSDPGKIVPHFEPEEGSSLYFKLYFNDPSRISRLEFFPDASNVQYGFPQLYVGERKDPSVNTVDLDYQKIALRPAVFSFQVKDSYCGLSSADEASWKLKNEKKVVVLEGSSKKDSNGFFNCSIDMCGEPSGLYSLEIGSSSTDFFIDTAGEFQGCTAVIKILKNNLLPYENNWSDTNYVKFLKTIIKK
jgi:hypothetical protein